MPRTQICSICESVLQVYRQTHTVLTAWMLTGFYFYMWQTKSYNSQGKVFSIHVSITDHNLPKIASKTGINIFLLLS